MITTLLAFVTLAPLDRAVYQVGTLQTLMDGRYDGTHRIREVLSHGGFGLGTYNGLDGEGVVLDGTAFRVDPYGNTHAMPGDTLTPFMFTTAFRADKAFRLSAGSHVALEAAVNKAFPDGSVAIRVDGEFDKLTARSFPIQYRPYLGLGKIMDRQALLPYGRIEGTLVGFRMAKSVGNRNVPGFHFHFLSDDRDQGGHVLAYSIVSARVRVMKLSGIKQLP